MQACSVALGGGGLLPTGCTLVRGVAVSGHAGTFWRCGSTHLYVGANEVHGLLCLQCTRASSTLHTLCVVCVLLLLLLLLLLGGTRRA